MSGVCHYSFPIGALPAEISSSFWGTALLGKEAGDVTIELRSIWPEAADSEVHLLREKFLSFIPSGLSCWGEAVYLRLDHPDFPGGPGGRGDCYYFSEPGSKDELAETFSGFWIGASPGIMEFFLLFRGLRESIDMAGGFELPSEWIGFGEEIAPWREYIEDLDAIEPWEASVKIYHALNGDMVLMNGAGCTAWYRLEDQTIQPIATRFEDFLGYFRRHLDCHWPFDSHGMQQSPLRCSHV